MKITRNDGFSIESGNIIKNTDVYKFVTPKGKQSLCICCCTVDHLPYSAIVGMMLKVINPVTEEPSMADFVQISKAPLRNLDMHDHFDPVYNFKKNFRRMKSIEILTVKK
jgi:hypothetical protein